MYVQHTSTRQASSGASSGNFDFRDNVVALPSTRGRTFYDGAGVIAVPELPDTPPKEARRFLELLTGESDPVVRFRSLPDAGSGGGRKHHGRLSEVWPDLADDQREGYGVYVVVNDGGDRDREITTVRALFLDADGVELDPDGMDLPVHAVSHREGDRGRAHYWTFVDGPSVGEFRALQKARAGKYGTDGAVHNPSRVMRLPGTFNLKDPSAPARYVLDDRTGGKRRGEVALGQGDVALAVPVEPEPEPTRRDDGGARPTGGWDPPGSLESALDYLERLPECAESEPWGAGEAQVGRDRLVYEAACQLRDLAVSDRIARQLLERFDREKCRPPLGDATVGEKVASAYGGNAQNAPGAKSPASVFAGIHVPANDDPVSVFAVRELAEEAVEWDLKGWLLSTTTNLTSGPGTLGKSTWGIYEGAAVSAGVPLFGIEARRRPVLYVTNEDSRKVVQSRFDAACRVLGVDDGDVLAFEIWDRRDSADGNLIARVLEDGTVQDGPFAERLADAINGLTARCGVAPLVVLDTVNDFVKVNKNDDNAVRAVVRQVLDGVLCRRLGCTISAILHPSAAGLADNRDTGGSEEWRNAPRMHRTFVASKSPDHRPRAADEKRDARLPWRLLTRAKCNYAPGGEVLPLAWNERTQTFHVPSRAETAEQRRDVQHHVENAVLRMIDRGLQVTRTDVEHAHGPSDVAVEVVEQDGPELNAKEVRAHLKTAERHGRLVYQKAVGKTLAGYRRPIMQVPASDPIDQEG